MLALFGETCHVGPIPTLVAILNTIAASRFSAAFARMGTLAANGVFANVAVLVSISVRVARIISETTVTVADVVVAIPFAADIGGTVDTIDTVTAAGFARNEFVFIS